MWNLFPLGILKNPCSRFSISRSRKVLQVIKMDGKIMEFTSPLLVKELVMNLEGLVVKSSRKSSRNLPPTFELKLGRLYYLLPCDQTPDHHPQTRINRTASIKPDDPDSIPVKRIKVVITKKQLQELVLSSKKTSVEKIVVGIDTAAFTVISVGGWRPNLTSIPEENELKTMSKYEMENCQKKYLS